MRRFPAVFLLTLGLLLGLLPLAASAQTATAAPREGVDYVLIENGTPWQPLGGKIEVVEVFSYLCGHCNDMQPLLDAWKARQRADVRVTYLPLASGPNDQFSRGYFAVLDGGKLARVHGATFRAVHAERSLPRNPSAEQMASFYRTQGLDGAALQRAMAADGVGERLAKAYRWALDNGVEGTPTLVINGRYRITGRSHQDTLRIADALIAQLRAARR